MQEQKSTFGSQKLSGDLDPISGLTEINITYADVGLIEYQQMFTQELRKIRSMIESIQNTMVELHDKIIYIEENT